MLRRLPPEVLEQALLRSESRGLWLKGTHARKKTKADSKNIVGVDLRETLSPTEDQTYALNSARSVLADAPDRSALTGTVGTTPRRSLVWNKPTDNLVEFVKCASELLDLIEATFGADMSPVFPLLTQPVSDLANVWGAYDLACADATEIPSEVLDDEKNHAAEILAAAVLSVRGISNSADFEIDVGMNGTLGGVVHASMRQFDGRLQLNTGLQSGASDPTIAGPVAGALRQTDLLTVYYASGHTFTNGQLFKPQTKPMPFPNWRWCDFSGYEICREKPGDGTWGANQIHAAIGTEGDRSIFGWVQRSYSDWWLTCDDGPGEMADFIDIGSDGTLRFIHVKGANSSGPRRAISATAYEVVTSQAVKNAVFLDSDVLLRHLGKSTLSATATWTDGVRASDRSDFLEALEARDARDRYEVVIVQPHVSKSTYDRLYNDSTVDSLPPDLLRLQRLEMILNGGRPTMTGRGSDLFVIESLI